jgi:hypothetical protein
VTSEPIDIVATARRIPARFFTVHSYSFITAGDIATTIRGHPDIGPSSLG